MSNTPIVKYFVRRRGASDTEEILANRTTWLEDPATCLFWQDDLEVTRILAGDMQTMPEPIYGVLSPEEQSRMRQEHGKYSDDKMGFQANL
jgi:hypothetical protein